MKNNRVSEKYVPSVLFQPSFASSNSTLYALKRVSIRKSQSQTSTGLILYSQGLKFKMY